MNLINENYSYLNMQLIIIRIKKFHLDFRFAKWLRWMIENPCVGGSIPPRATKIKWYDPVTLFTQCTGHILYTFSDHIPITLEPCSIVIIRRSGFSYSGSRLGYQVSDMSFKSKPDDGRSFLCQISAD